MIEEWEAKPVTVRAIKWTGDNLEEIRQFCNNMAFVENGKLYVETMEGTSRAHLNGYIVQGTRGEFYPVKPEVMHDKYNKKGNNA